MANLNFAERIEENSKDIGNMERLLGKSLKQPFTNTNAGANILASLSSNR